MMKTTFIIELAIYDNRFVEQKILGSNSTRKTIYKGSASNDELALHEAELICGELEDSSINRDTVGRKYRIWTRTHTLYKEYKYTSCLVVTFKSEL